MTISSVCALKLKGQEQLDKAQAYHGQYTKNKMARQSEFTSRCNFGGKYRGYMARLLCLYDVRSPDNDDRDMREKAFQETAEKLKKPGNI